MHRLMQIPLGIIRPVDPVARYRKPETLGYRPFRNKRRKLLQHHNNNAAIEDQRVDEYA